MAVVACHENVCPPAKNCPRTKYCSKSLAKNCPTCQFLSHWRIALQKGPNVGRHNIMYIAILANRVAKGSQWQATYSRYLYWRIALQKDRNGGRHIGSYWPIVLQKDRRGGRHLVLANRVSERQPRRATPIGLERST